MPFATWFWIWHRLFRKLILILSQTESTVFFSVGHELHCFSTFVLIDCCSACSIQEGRCALAKSPRQPTASLAESELSASDMDDEALRADLQSLSGSSVSRGRSREACLTAPPTRRAGALARLFLRSRCLSQPQESCGEAACGGGPSKGARASPSSSPCGASPGGASPGGASPSGTVFFHGAGF